MEIYKDKYGKFRWRLIHTNGQVIAKLGESYIIKVNAVKGISSLRENVPNATVEDKTAA